MFWSQNYLLYLQDTWIHSGLSAVVQGRIWVQISQVLNCFWAVKLFSLEQYLFHGKVRYWTQHQHLQKYFQGIKKPYFKCKKPKVERQWEVKLQMLTYLMVWRCALVEFFCHRGLTWDISKTLNWFLIGSLQSSVIYDPTAAHNHPCMWLRY